MSFSLPHRPASEPGWKRLLSLLESPSLYMDPSSGLLRHQWTTRWYLIPSHETLRQTVYTAQSGSLPPDDRRGQSVTNAVQGGRPPCQHTDAGGPHFPQTVKLAWCILFLGLPSHTEQLYFSHGLTILFRDPSPSMRCLFGIRRVPCFPIPRSTEDITTYVCARRRERGWPQHQARTGSLACFLGISLRRTASS